MLCVLNSRFGSILHAESEYSFRIFLGRTDGEKKTILINVDELKAVMPREVSTLIFREGRC